MEDSFKARVERLFGSHLFEKVPRSAFPESSWSVVEGEVEKKEWNRKAGEEHPNREETPLASSYSECFSKSSRRPRNSERRRFVEDLEDEEDLEEEKDEGEGIEDEERDIRSSIGLDSTLDFEVVDLSTLIPIREIYFRNNQIIYKLFLTVHSYFLEIIDRFR